MRKNNKKNIKKRILSVTATGLVTFASFSFPWIGDIKSYANRTTIIGKIHYDSGHGQMANGSWNGSSGFIKEETANIRMAEAAINRTKERGFPVSSTCIDGKFISLEERGKKIKYEENADVLISIHNNASSSKDAKGFETLQHKMKGSGDTRLTDAIYKNWGALDFMGPARPKKYEARQGSPDAFTPYLVRTHDRPMCITEGMFVTNEEEANWVMDDEKVKQCGEALADAVMEGYYGLKPGENYEQWLARNNMKNESDAKVTGTPSTPTTNTSNSDNHVEEEEEKKDDNGAGDDPNKNNVVVEQPKEEPKQEEVKEEPKQEETKSNVVEDKISIMKAFSNLLSKKVEKVDQDKIIEDIPAIAETISDGHKELINEIKTEELKSQDTKGLE